MKTDKIFPLWKRIGQVFLQILLFPLSVLMSAAGGYPLWHILYFIVAKVPAEVYVLGIPAILMGSLITVPLGYLILKIFGKIKAKSYLIEDPVEGTTYTYQADVTHNVYDNRGYIVGSYTTTETKEGCSFSDDERENIERCILISIVAIPCRIISLIASIIACFEDSFFVSVRTPKGIGKYNQFLFTYFDIVVMKK